MKSEAFPGGKYAKRLPDPQSFFAPTYDDDGNQEGGLMPTTTVPERNLLVFTYNSENRPISVSQNGEALEVYNYDHMGRRIRNGDTITIYDGYNAIAEYKGSTKVLKKIYAWGIDLSDTTEGAGGAGGLLSITEYDRQLPFVSYPCYDGNGNITEYLTEENSGTLITHYEYDAFGQVVRNTGNREYNYQFSTKSYNALTGLYYYNYRDYDSAIGRWMGRDSVEEKGGLNLYGFIGNYPVNNIDINGQAFPLIPFFLGAGVFILVDIIMPEVWDEIRGSKCDFKYEEMIIETSSWPCKNKCYDRALSSLIPPYRCHETEGKSKGKYKSVCKKSWNLISYTWQFESWEEEPHDCDAAACDSCCQGTDGIEYQEF